jgi:myo-inositol-1(or 4)-monophosphatase
LQESEILDKVSGVVKLAGEIAKEGFRHSKVVLEKARADVATDYDLRIEKEITSFILKAFPDHGIISEESGPINSDRDYVWILDPIDGSKHYARGIPLYGVCLALAYRDKLRLGVVYLPESDELFTAAKGSGAYLNGERVSCCPEEDLANALLCVEIPSRHDTPEQLDTAMARLKTLILNGLRVRIVGLSCYGMCHVAFGGFGAYVNLGSSSEIWDLAASEVILAEAGAVLSRVSGVIVAGPKPIHDAILKVLDL